MSKGKHTTFRFNQEIRDAFKEEIEARGMSMTEALEGMMINYIKIVKRGKEEKN